MAPRVFYFRKVGLCLENVFFYLCVNWREGGGGGLATKDEQLSIKTYWGGKTPQRSKIRKGQSLFNLNRQEESSFSIFYKYININLRTYNACICIFLCYCISTNVCCRPGKSVPDIIPTPSNLLPLNVSYEFSCRNSVLFIRQCNVASLDDWLFQKRFTPPPHRGKFCHPKGVGKNLSLVIVTGLGHPKQVGLTSNSSAGRYGNVFCDNL